MDRRNFLGKGLMGAGAAALAGAATGLDRPSTSVPPVGFDHLPTPTPIIMDNQILHKAESRGHADHGWLKSFHSFSFASYYDPTRMHFGALRVLNDDSVAPGMGFGTHPHQNMEIISIPLLGDLEHRDSMGNTAVIRKGDVQVMSAGTGIRHSEYNRNKDAEVKFLQVWVFPDKQGVTPRYDQISLDPAKRQDRWQQILSPNAEDEGVWIHQNAWFHLGSFSKGAAADYELKDKRNGVYVFVIEGQVTVNGTPLNRRDGLCVEKTPALEINALSDGTEVLLMEILMIVPA